MRVYIVNVTAFEADGFLFQYHIYLAKMQHIRAHVIIKNQMNIESKIRSGNLSQINITIKNKIKQTYPVDIYKY